MLAVQVHLVAHPLVAVVVQVVQVETVQQELVLLAMVDLV
jgi:hypothetical protein